MVKKVLVISFSILLLVGMWVVKHKTTPKNYFLSVVAIMKNEKPYLKEWIEYHLLQGVEHFYLCDNDSTDGSKEYLEPYIKSGIITYIKQSGVNQQLKCYAKVVEKYKEETTWLAIIDLDEYLVPLHAKNMVDFLREYDDVAEVSLHWMNYGDANAVSRANGLITEFFTSHSRFLNHTVKSIVRPEKVINFDAFGSNHYVRVNGPSVNEYHKPVDYMLNFNISGDKARVNHYIVKTFAEFLHKKSRGHPEGTKIDYAYYFFHNDNEIKNDTTMHRFLPQLKKRMQYSPLPDIDVPTVSSLPATFSEIEFTASEASQILGKPISHTMKFDEVEKAYKNNYPIYNR